MAPSNNDVPFVITRLKLSPDALAYMYNASVISTINLDWTKYNNYDNYLDSKINVYAHSSLFTRLLFDLSFWNAPLIPFPLSSFVYPL